MKKENLIQRLRDECDKRYPNVYDPNRTVFMSGGEYLLDLMDITDEVLEPSHPNEYTENFHSSIFLSLKGLTKAVAMCNTEEELLHIYNDNKERIDNSPGLKQLFTIRKNQLRRVTE